MRLLKYFLAAALILSPSISLAKEKSYIDTSSPRNGSNKDIFAFVGTYQNEEFLKNKKIMSAYKAIVPSNEVKALFTNSEVQPPIYFYDGYIIASGCMQHSCGFDEAEIWVNANNIKDTMVVLTQNQKTKIYTTKPWEEMPQSFKMQHGKSFEPQKSEDAEIIVK